MDCSATQACPGHDADRTLTSPDGPPLSGTAVDRCPGPRADGSLCDARGPWERAAPATDRMNRGTGGRWWGGRVRPTSGRTPARRHADEL
ncbi:hypothetical protein SHO565_29810 [Streptomyces sp. HO565]